MFQTEGFGAFFFYSEEGKRRKKHVHSGKTAKLITRDEAVPYLPDGGVAIDGTKIAAVGSTAELKAKYPDAEFIDAKGGVIMPGLVNAHTHIYSALARGLSIKRLQPHQFL